MNDGTQWAPHPNYARHFHCILFLSNSMKTGGTFGHKSLINDSDRARQSFFGLTVTTSISRVVGVIRQYRRLFRQEGVL